jgi:formylglycine-generating enzyme required for sulfatase activity
MLSIVLGSIGCSHRSAGGGGLVIVLRDDALLPADRLEAQVGPLDGGAVYADAGAAWDGSPTTIAIDSNGDPAASVAIALGVSGESGMIDSRRYRVRNVPTDRVKVLDVDFHGECAAPPACTAADAGVVCDVGQVCGPGTGACAGADVDARSLPDYAPNALGGPADAGGGGACMLGDRRCSERFPQICNSGGQWITQQGCTSLAANEHCVGAGQCVPLPPSCSNILTGEQAGPAGAGFDCAVGGPDCCASTPVPAGSFLRDYDGMSYTVASHRATVSAFDLDVYEVTVGRFRQFVATALQTGWKPPAGSGKHAHLSCGGLAEVGDGGASRETGWLAAWDAALPQTAADWDAHLACGAAATWTPSPGCDGCERRPINCVDWYDAYAFCIWDGGFLPSEAEWDYAAAGGSAQRVYSWGNQLPTEAPALAIWDCSYGTGPCPNVERIAPVGSVPAGISRWGQLDLTGNIAEWTLDVEARYADPCMDCANTTGGMPRVFRGGSFDEIEVHMPVSYRDGEDAGASRAELGIRCARSPLL